MEDRDIIALYLERDQKAIVETEKKYGRYCYSIAYNILYNAEDAEETRKAAFLIHISQWNNEKIEGGKITFSFSEFLSQKNTFDEKLSGLDLSRVTTAEETQKPESIRGGSGRDLVDCCLVPIEGGILSPVDGVTITNVGVIDNKLHIQIYFEDISSYDNHGFVDLRDEAGNQAEYYSIHFWDDEKAGSYDEIIYDISPEDIENYQAYGYFVTCKNRTKGNWQVTFPLENKVREPSQFA